MPGTEFCRRVDGGAVFASPKPLCRFCVMLLCHLNAKKGLVIMPEGRECVAASAVLKKGAGARIPLLPVAFGLLLAAESAFREYARSPGAPMRSRSVCDRIICSRICFYSLGELAGRKCKKTYRGVDVIVWPFVSERQRQDIIPNVNDRNIYLTLSMGCRIPCCLEEALEISRRGLWFHQWHLPYPPSHL